MSSKDQVRWVGIDLGGTNIKAGCLDATGAQRRGLEVPSLVHEGPEAVTRRIVELARELGATHSLGIGVPGLVDHARGLITRSPNLSPLEGFPLRERLAAELGLAEDHIQLENDACVAALGEFWIGGARDFSHVMMVTLGTGVGGGLILDGELYTGSSGLAAEIGHVVVDPLGPLCGCGNRGCLEALASAEAASRRCLAAGLPSDLVEVSERARRGDPTSSRVLREIGLDLGRGLASALMLLDLEAFLIGGGFGAALDVLTPGILDGLLERSYGRSRAELRLLPAKLGSSAGWIGAAKLASDRATR